ncbi:hypothetical protein CBM2615_B200051 [Cupriavidus taiwanensis]|nr:hypothetical protein CBM2615_B200051 [Cupriavidus taiwanensis]
MSAPGQLRGPARPQMAGDLLHALRQHAVAGALEHEQFGIGNAIGQHLAVAKRAIVVFTAVDDERRATHLCQRRTLVGVADRLPRPRHRAMVCRLAQPQPPFAHGNGFQQRTGWRGFEPSHRVQLRCAGNQQQPCRHRLFRVLVRAGNISQRHGYAQAPSGQHERAAHVVAERAAQHFGAGIERTSLRIGRRHRLAAPGQVGHDERTAIGQLFRQRHPRAPRALDAMHGDHRHRALPYDQYVIVCHAAPRTHLIY